MTPTQAYVHRPDARATDAQISYLQKLLVQAFAAGVRTYLDRHHLERVTRGEASEEIGRIKAGLAEYAAARASR